MRDLIVSNIVSLDGYFEGPGKNVMALPFDEAFDKYNAERLRAADTLLVGRTTFEGLKAYWPPLADDPAAPAVEREIAKLLNGIEKVVISDTLTPEQTAPWTGTRVVRRADAAAEVAALKSRAGADILVVGSHSTWNGLLAAGLVDELHLMIGPAFVGGGTPAYEGDSPFGLRLIESRTLENSQLILARYSAR